MMYPTSNLFVDILCNFIQRSMDVWTLFVNFFLSFYKNGHGLLVGTEIVVGVSLPILFLKKLGLCFFRQKEKNSQGN